MNVEAIAGWVALYAAVVSTGALALEIRRWFESGVRITLSYVIGAMLVPSSDEQKRHIIVTASNRGELPTTIDNFGLLAYPSRIARLFGKPNFSAIVNQPAHAQPIPFFLGPGARWTGMCVQDKELERLLDSRLVWAAVYTTDADRPTMIRLLRRPEPKGKKI